MKKLLPFLFIVLWQLSAGAQGLLQVSTRNGRLEGVDESGVISFKGVPFAQPPVGNLRWREPLPPKNWEGVKNAANFGPRAMQLPLFSDMMFRSAGVSEDCLYLNVWTPAKKTNEQLPVLVYFYGGGLQAGDGSELRYDGESLARKGIVTITVNYRLNIFGFFAHPELTKESPNHASGNYGLLDQQAALVWVQNNISFFGGDPKKVTIAGESAGSFSVSAQMASPLSKKLLAGAIGESGSLLNMAPTALRAEVEDMGVQFTKGLELSSLAALRALPADKLLEASAKQGAPRFPVCVDGYFFTKSPALVFAEGEQAKVPLLVGWNSQEANAGAVLGKEIPTTLNFEGAVKRMYPGNAEAYLAQYRAAGDEEVEQVATDLASDRFIGFSTWRWSDLHVRTGGKPVYRYLYARARPALRSQTATEAVRTDATKKLPLRGAAHSAEIEYALGNLLKNRVYDWQPADARISEIMQSFFANFIKTGNPNGAGVPAWAPVIKGMPAPVMRIDADTKLETEKHRERYLFLESLAK